MQTFIEAAFAARASGHFSLTAIWSGPQMQESFSRSSVSCLINSNLHSELENSPAEDKKNNPCWQVTQQLHYHIEKVLFYFLFYPLLFPPQLSLLCM